MSSKDISFTTPGKWQQFCSKYKWYICGALVTAVVAVAIAVPVWLFTGKETIDFSSQHFFTTTRKNGQYIINIEHPPDSNIINDGEFTCNTSGLHLFSLLRGTNGGTIKLQINDEEVVTIPKDNIKSNTLTIALDLNIDDKVKVVGDGDLTLSGLNLYGDGHKTDSTYLWGSGMTVPEVENVDQTIILKNEHHQNGVNFENGAVKITTQGVYLMTLNLGSEDMSYASLNINGAKTIGLGEDRDGRNIMSNFIIKELNVSDTIEPTLEALGKIYDDGNQTQLAVISLTPYTKESSFCAYSSHYNELKTLDTVIFDQTFLSNKFFDTSSGIFTHHHEPSNPEGFYLLSATAYMGKIDDSPSAELKIEQKQNGDFVPIGVATTTSTMRSMLQVTAIVKMDQYNDSIRVRAAGFMDEGPDVHFATFCGFRLGI